MSLLNVRAEPTQKRAGSEMAGYCQYDVEGSKWIVGLLLRLLNDWKRLTLVRLRGICLLWF